MSVSAFPSKGPAVSQLQLNPHRSSFQRVQPASSPTKSFTSNLNQVPPHLSTDYPHLNHPSLHNQRTNSSPTYSGSYRKITPTVVDSYSLTQTNQTKTDHTLSSANTSETAHLLFRTSTGTEFVSQNNPNSSNYRAMDYSTLPISFHPAPNYMTREHAHEMKTSSTLASYHQDPRSNDDYTRLDFNPIVESLNFAATAPNYELGPNTSFGTWPAHDGSMEVDNELKSRVDFRSQLLGNGNSISRLADDFRVAEQLYNGNARRGPHGFNGTTRGLCELDHFTMIGSRPDPGNNCISQFDSNGYPTMDGRNQSTGEKAAVVSVGMMNNIGSVLSTPNCRTNPPSMVVSRTAAPCAPTPTQTLVVSANDNSMVSSAMMTPDSSTTGFLTNKFTGSSDDGELSPTPTNSSGRPQTPGRTRKAAPTLATGRRNLKGELVDPDEADRRMKRRERNRKSAQKCRERKVQRTQELQAQVEYLQLEINRLTQERDNLQNEARQFVTLLQLHCPGVAIPYMSCLNEIPETMVSSTLELANTDAIKAVTTASPTNINNTGSCTSSNSNSNSLRAPTVPSAWKSKPSSKLRPLSEVIHTINTTTTAPQSSPFSPLQTMVSLHSGMSPTQSKSTVTFGMVSNDQSSCSGGLNPGNVAHTSVVDIGYRATSDTSSAPIVRCTSTASAQGPASSSSSSSCSTYELSFTNLETPIRTPLLTAPYEDQAGREPNLCSVAEQSVTFQVPQSTITSCSGSASINQAAELTQIKCEEWDPHFIDPSGPIRPDKVDPLQIIRSEGAGDEVFVNSMDSALSNGHCDLHPDQSNTSGADAVCF